MNLNRYVLRLWTVGLITIVMAMTAFGGTASAAVPGLQLVSAQSASNSSSKSVTVSCPSGKVVIGAGGQVNVGTSGRAVLDEITPLPNLSGVTAVGVETVGGTTSNWTVKAYAICASAGAVPGLQLVSAQSAINSSVKSVTASCPSGKQLIGAGGQINATSGEAVLDEITPLPNLSGVTTVGVEPGSGTANSWSVKSYAICATP